MRSPHDEVAVVLPGETLGFALSAPGTHETAHQLGCRTKVSFLGRSYTSEWARGALADESGDVGDVTAPGGVLAFERTRAHDTEGTAW